MSVQSLPESACNWCTCNRITVHAKGRGANVSVQWCRWHDGRGIAGLSGGGVADVAVGADRRDCSSFIINGDSGRIFISYPNRSEFLVLILRIFGNPFPSCQELHMHFGQEYFLFPHKGETHKYLDYYSQTLE